MRVLLVLSGVLVTFLAGNWLLHERAKRLARSRSGSGFEDFVAYFATENIPEDKLRLVYEYLQDWQSVAEFNQNIVGVIEVIAEYRNVEYGDTIQRMAKEESSNDQDKPCVGGEQMSEAEIDYNVMGTFPASDPPSWTLGVRPHKTCSEEFEGERLSPNDPSHKNEPEE